MLKIITFTYLPCQNQICCHIYSLLLCPCLRLYLYLNCIHFGDKMNSKHSLIVEMCYEGVKMKDESPDCKNFSAGKFMTGWPAYGMLAFQLYRWNQLSHSRGLYSAYKKRIPGHRRSLAFLCSAPDVMLQSHSRCGSNNLTLTLRYC